MALLVGTQYSADVGTTTSTGVVLGGTVPFNANHAWIQNRGTVPLRASFASTAPSTGDIEIPPGAAGAFRGLNTSKFGLLTTSTSTDGTDHRRARVALLEGG